MHSWIGLAAAVSAVFLLFACSGGKTEVPKGLGPPPWIHGDFPPDLPRPVHERAFLELAGERVEVELAVTARGRQYGLMFVEDLPEDKGMLFVYPEPHVMTFWMRNTRIPLDLVYITELSGKCRVLNIQREMQPFEEQGDYDSFGECRFALELKGGWADRHGLKAGDPVEIPDQVRRLQVTADDPFRRNIPRRIGPK